MKEEEELRDEGKGKGQKERRVSVGSQVGKSYDCVEGREKLVQVETGPSGSQSTGVAGLCWCRWTMLVSLDHADVEVWMYVKVARGSPAKWKPGQAEVRCRSGR